jgi:hypothetical protein
MLKLSRVMVAILNFRSANLKQTWHGWSLSGQFSKLCPVTLTSIQDGHLQQTYCSFNIDKQKNIHAYPFSEKKTRLFAAS